MPLVAALVGLDICVVTHLIARGAQYTKFPQQRLSQKFIQVRIETIKLSLECKIFLFLS